MTELAKWNIEFYKHQIEFWSSMLKYVNKAIEHDNMCINECRKEKNQDQLEYWMNERRKDYRERDRYRRLVRNNEYCLHVEMLEIEKGEEKK